MRRKNAFLAVLIASAALIGAGFYTAHVEAQNQNSSNSNQPQPQSSNDDSEKPKQVWVTVVKGDSLSKIGQKHKTTYQRLFDANLEVKDPDLIYAGQKLRIPDASEKLAKRPLPNEAPVQTVSSSNYQPTSTGPQVSGGVWDRLAACESGGNWAINTGNGYYGGLQFTLSTWRSVGGSGYPHQASKSEQIKRGQILQARSGWGQWPACSARLGLS